MYHKKIFAYLVVLFKTCLTITNDRSFFDPCPCMIYGTFTRYDMR